MSGLVQLLGYKAIEGSAGSYREIAVESLEREGKVCGLYFAKRSCVAFTSELVHWYESFRRENKSGEDLDMVFVSLDESQLHFEECFDPMPWLALPFAERSKAVSCASTTCSTVTSLILVWF